MVRSKGFVFASWFKIVQTFRPLLFIQTNVIISFRLEFTQLFFQVFPFSSDVGPYVVHCYKPEYSGNSKHTFTLQDIYISGAARYISISWTRGNNVIIWWSVSSCHSRGWTVEPVAGWSLMWPINKAVNTPTASKHLPSSIMRQQLKSGTQTLRGTLINSSSLQTFFKWR